jgi:diphosphomevalonate decarboxylase
VTAPGRPADAPPPGKATAGAPANIALVKYWGARDLDRALPLNPSISMTLRRCRSRTTVEVAPGGGEDEVWLAGSPGGTFDLGVAGGAVADGRDERRDPPPRGQSRPAASAGARRAEPPGGTDGTVGTGAAAVFAGGGETERGPSQGRTRPAAGVGTHRREPARDEFRPGEAAAPLHPAPADFAARVRRHLDELRRWAGIAPGAVRFRVATVNSFPAAAGLASSASGFAALAVAAAAALGRDAPPAELSSLARRSGSGSAARSVLGGYVEWPAPAPPAAAGSPPPDPDDDPRAALLAPAAHWALRDVIAVVERGAKQVSSLAGHRLAPTSPHFARRLAELPARLATVRRAILDRDFAALAPAVEEEAIDLHLIAMSSRPPIFYWQPATLAVLAAVRALRRDGVAACATLDAGANVHVLCPAAAEEEVAARLAVTPGVHEVLRDGVGDGPELHDEHLF